MEEMDEDKELMLLDEILDRHQVPDGGLENSYPRRWPEMAFKVAFPLVSTALASAVRVLVERVLEG